VHRHRVREDDSLEAQLLAQQAGEDRPAERRRPSFGRIERGQPDVRGHHGVDARGDRRPERHELHGVERARGVLDHREVEVGVGRRVAVAGEVLGGREHAALLDPAHVRGRHARHQLGSSPNERMLITGFCGFTFTSTTG
jgi:hypothetical protein